MDDSLKRKEIDLCGEASRAGKFAIVVVVEPGNISDGVPVMKIRGTSNISAFAPPETWAVARDSLRGFSVLCGSAARLSRPGPTVSLPSEVCLILDLENCTCEAQFFLLQFCPLLHLSLPSSNSIRFIWYSVSMWISTSQS